jgi:hypothetical protein
MAGKTILKNFLIPLLEKFNLGIGSLLIAARGAN